MATEEFMERLLNVFQDLKKNFAANAISWRQHITEAELSYLRETFSDQRNVLAECLADIDQQILACVLLVEDYGSTSRILGALNERISRLGAEPLVMPEGLPGGSVADIIIARIQYLKSQGRL